ncbi:MAG: hypothetical protein HBSAPP03_21600 [Phycisphaerae bacterium]|nr:MAG: hypothetical protein HBSAPP03_21600 [Phycisphaerae bacterium]
MSARIAARIVIQGVIHTVALAAPLTLAGTLGGCGIVYQPAKFKGAKSTAAPHVVGSPLNVVSDNGAITVTMAPGNEVLVTASIRAESQARLDAVTVNLDRREDGTLAVRVNWPEGRRGPSEGADLEISLPDATGVTLKTSNGALTTRGLSGPADLQTSNGAVTVHGHTGHVTAKSSNGRIELYDVPSAVADTSNGRVMVRLTASGEGPVELDTSNGAITLEVGPGFNAQLTASTSNGGVSCSAAGAKVISTGKGRGSFTFGEGTQACKLHTSNGGITISNRP